MKSEKYAIKNTAGMFDLLKGIVMLSIIVVHTLSLYPSRFTYEALQDNVSSSQVFPIIMLILYSIFKHPLMPSLFFISGYGFRKTSFKKNEDPCTCPKNFPVCVCGKVSKGTQITRKPIVPTDEELSINSRSKSAKLRVFERK